MAWPKKIKPIKRPSTVIYRCVRNLSLKPDHILLVALQIIVGLLVWVNRRIMCRRSIDIWSSFCNALRIHRLWIVQQTFSFKSWISIGVCDTSFLSHFIFLFVPNTRIKLMVFTFWKIIFWRGLSISVNIYFSKALKTKFWIGRNTLKFLLNVGLYTLWNFHRLFKLRLRLTIFFQAMVSFDNLF